MGTEVLTDVATDEAKDKVDEGTVNINLSSLSLLLWNNV